MLLVVWFCQLVVITLNKAASILWIEGNQGLFYEWSQQSSVTSDHGWKDESIFNEDQARYVKLQPGTHTPPFSDTISSQQLHPPPDNEPDRQADLWCPWNSWCCVMYSAVDSIFKNHSQSTESLCLKPCWILFLLLFFTSPITIGPVEKQCWETRAKTGMPISSEHTILRFRGRLAGCQISQLKCSNLKVHLKCRSS